MNFVIGNRYRITWQFSCCGDYEDESFIYTYAGKAEDHCEEFQTPEEKAKGHSTHAFYSEELGSWFIDDMEITPCLIEAI